MASSHTATELPTIKLYWLEKSRAQSILWLLEELELPYEIEIFHRNPKTKLAPPELKKIHALGKSPVIALTPAHSSEPRILAESSFIVEYLLDNFGGGFGLQPWKYKEGLEGRFGAETEEWMRFRYFMSYVEGSLMPILVMSVVADGIKQAPVPFFIKPIVGRIAGGLRSSYVDPNIKSHFEFLEDQIITSPKSGKYICGPRLTAADIMLSFPLIAAMSKGTLTKEGYPNLCAYAQRLQEEPGYKKAVGKIVETEGSYEVS